MIKKIILFLLGLIFFSAIKGQSEKMDLKIKRSAYLTISTGLSYVNFRDFRTSPLNYKGVGYFSQISHLKTSDYRESELGISYQRGTYNNNFNDQSSEASVYTISLFYGNMYQLNLLSNKNWNTKIGALFSLTGNYRDNPSLQNYSLGTELINTLFFSAKTELKFARKAQKRKKLSYQINAGVLNSNARGNLPKFYDAILTNDENLQSALDLKVFSGFRVKSALAYTVYLKNKNAIQFSYEWEAYNTGDDGKQFEMAHRTLKFSLLFNTKNK